jgi:cytochrome c oxidase subunit IV
MSEHIVSPRMYVMVFLALLVGTALTVLAAYVDLGRMNLTVAMAIAVTKASLVVLFFMHLKWMPKLFKVTFGSAFFFFIILVTITMSDYLTRERRGLESYVPSGIAPSAPAAPAPPAH